MLRKANKLFVPQVSAVDQAWAEAARKQNQKIIEKYSKWYAGKGQK